MTFQMIQWMSGKLSACRQIQGLYDLGWARSLSKALSQQEKENPWSMCRQEGRSLKLSPRSTGDPIMKEIWLLEQGWGVGVGGRLGNGRTDMLQRGTQNAPRGGSVDKRMRSDPWVTGWCGGTLEAGRPFCLVRGCQCQRIRVLRVQTERVGLQAQCFPILGRSCLIAPVTFAITFRFTQPGEIIQGQSSSKGLSWACVNAR